MLVSERGLDHDLAKVCGGLKENGLQREQHDLCWRKKYDLVGGSVSL